MKDYVIVASQLSDEALLAKVTELAGRERECTAELVAHLAEVDARDICLARGRSLYLYCTQVLHLSEHAAYNRIGAARVARRFPAVLDRLADGSVNVTTVTLLGPHLTESNQERLLGEAAHKTKDEVKEIVRRLDPLPPAKTVLRAVAVPAAPASPAQPSSEPATGTSSGSSEDGAAARPVSSGGTPAPPARPPIEARAANMFRLHLDVDRKTRDVLRRLQDLLARETGGDLSEIVARAARLLLTEVERKKLAAVAAPRPPRAPREGSRHIAASVRRAVRRRDEDRCTFVGADGRCPETRYLEWHHRVPYALGGPGTIENITLRCRAHNVYESEVVFGKFDAGVVRETAAPYGARAERELGLERVRKVTRPVSADRAAGSRPGPAPRTPPAPPARRAAPPSSA